MPSNALLAGAMVALLLSLAACTPASLRQSPSLPAHESGAATPTIERRTTPVIGEFVPPPDLSLRDPSACPQLESVLQQLIHAEDADAFANQRGLLVRDGRVQVILVLAGDDADFLRQYDTEPGTRWDEQMQTWVPIDRLCDLANAEGVLAVRVPSQALPQ